MPATVIVNARLVNEGRVTEGDLRIENGRIARMAAEIRPQGDDTVIDAAGRWLLPGMIDDQVHFREPGMPHKGDMATESAAAVAGLAKNGSPDALRLYPRAVALGRLCRCCAVGPGP